MTPRDDPETTRRFEAWLDDACRELGLDREVVAQVTPSMLRLVAGVAHGPARPAAPMTALLVGLASAGEGPADAEAIQARIAQVSTLLDGWQP